MHQQYVTEQEQTICYRKNQIDGSFSCVCPVIDDECHYIIVKVVCRSTQLSLHGSTATLFDNVMMKFMINSKTDA